MGAGISLGLAGGLPLRLNKGGQFHDDFFPQSTVNGVDGDAYVGYRVLADVRGARDRRLAPVLLVDELLRGSTRAATPINQCMTRRSPRAAPSTSTSPAAGGHRLTMGGDGDPVAEAEEPPPPPKRKRKAARTKKARARSPAGAARATTGTPAPIVHVDMDAFYASVEQRDDPALRGQARSSSAGTPAAGWCWRRRTRCARSASAAPCRWRARCALAPDAVVVPPRHDAYAEASARVFDIFGAVTPLVEPLSLDEAFLDVTASMALFGAPAEIARRLRARIADEVGPARVGRHRGGEVRGQDRLRPRQAERPAARSRPDGGAAFLAPLPVSRLWGVGPKSARDAARRWASRPSATWRRAGSGAGSSRLGPAGRALWEQAQRHRPAPGRPRPRGEEHRRRGHVRRGSVGRRGAAPASARAGAAGRRAGCGARALRARTVQLKLKRADFTLVTRRATLDEPTDDGQPLYREAARAARARAAHTPCA